MRIADCTECKLGQPELRGRPDAEGIALRYQFHCPTCGHSGPTTRAPDTALKAWNDQADAARKEAEAKRVAAVNPPALRELTVDRALAVESTPGVDPPGHLASIAPGECIVIDIGDGGSVEVRRSG